VWKVARSTSAAPTFFEPFRLEAEDGHAYALVDGGVYANNPAMCALAEARALFPNAEIVLASFGTGELCRPIAYGEAKDWGLVGWARPILDVVFDGVSDTVEFQVRQLIGEKFYRFQGLLEEGSDDLDDASPANLRVLQLHAERLRARSQAQLARLARLLSASLGSGMHARS
jgi:predicted acylesterase/phospholipase RssA